MERTKAEVMMCSALAGSAPLFFSVSPCLLCEQLSISSPQARKFCLPSGPVKVLASIWIDSSTDLFQLNILYVTYSATRLPNIYLLVFLTNRTWIKFEFSQAFLRANMMCIGCMGLWGKLWFPDIKEQTQLAAVPFCPFPFFLAKQTQWFTGLQPSGNLEVNSGAGK